MKFQIPNSKFQNIIFFSLCFALLINLLGCDAFVRKFTRKPKKENLPVEEMVVAPQEYTAPQITKEELYRQYLLYWKSWQDELINSLHKGASYKKQIECIDEAIKNLEQLRPLLKEEKIKILNTSISQMQNLRGAIAKDVYGNDVDTNRSAAENIKRNILRDLSCRKIKDCLA